jgi:hypothetical protein
MTLHLYLHLYDHKTDSQKPVHSYELQHNYLKEEELRGWIEGHIVEWHTHSSGPSGDFKETGELFYAFLTKPEARSLTFTVPSLPDRAWQIELVASPFAKEGTELCQVKKTACQVYRVWDAIYGTDYSLYDSERAATCRDPLLRAYFNSSGDSTVCVRTRNVTYTYAKVSPTATLSDTPIPRSKL